MLFNSTSFAIFLPIIFFLHWFVAKNNIRLQNILLLIASYYFYACWDWRFLFLLVFTIVLDYSTGIKMSEARTPGMKKFWFWLSISVNLGFLGFFKYYNFFISSFAQGLSELGVHTNPWVLKIILPVGISFYTFHGLSYVVDIYKDRIKPEKDFINYSLFVSFFPLLVAGPIERATHLLPQLQRERTFNYTKGIDGLRQILWGLFKKVVIADQCAVYANMAFTNPDYSGSTYLLGAVFFAFQIYCDFSGYSDIALGTARLFGVELLRNFAFPYFSRDIAEFWRRWHISLSTWFRDYVYIPLGGSKVSVGKRVRNTFIIFILSGFWHGANWTFIIWGLLNAIYFIPLLLGNKNRSNLNIVGFEGERITVRDILSILGTFALTTLAWVFFRADNLAHALSYLAEIFSPSLFTMPQFLPKKVFAFVGIFILIEWLGKSNLYAIEKFGFKWPRIARLGFYMLLILAIFFFRGQQQEFIYFQF